MYIHILIPSSFCISLYLTKIPNNKSHHWIIQIFIKILNRHIKFVYYLQWMLGNGYRTISFSLILGSWTNFNEVTSNHFHKIVLTFYRYVLLPFHVQLCYIFMYKISIFFISTSLMWCENYHSDLISNFIYLLAFSSNSAIIIFLSKKLNQKQDNIKSNITVPN